MRELERRVVLSVIDRRWRDHLYEMDYLKDGIGLRAMAQRDPLVEYQREGFAMFQQMMGSIREESVGFLFNLEVEVAPQAGVGGRRSRRRGSAVTSAPDEQAQLLGAERRAAGSRCATSAARCSRRRRSAPAARSPRRRRLQSSPLEARSASARTAAKCNRRTARSDERRTARVADPSRVREPLSRDLAPGSVSCDRSHGRSRRIPIVGHRSDRRPPRIVGHVRSSAKQTWVLRARRWRSHASAGRSPRGGWRPLVSALVDAP